MKIDLSQATFIIPIRIESSDRLRNVITITAFLVENFDTNIIVKEVDSKSVFQEQAMPILEEIVEGDIWKNFNFIFERSDKPLFHRQRVLNEMIMEADTDIVVNYDCVYEHPEGGWLMNSKELKYVTEKYSNFFPHRKYPDEN